MPEAHAASSGPQLISTFGDNMNLTMKRKALLIVGAASIFLAIAVITHPRSNHDSSSIVHESSYDWQLHERLIADLFDKTSKSNVISMERQSIESNFPKEKADAYMKQFEAGMASTVGVIMIEGGENGWLEQAYRKGFHIKTVFQNGYMEGLLQSAEHPDVMKTIK